MITPKLDWHDVHDLANKVIEVLKNELEKVQSGSQHYLMKCHW